MKIGFATSEDEPNLIDDDLLAVSVLKKKGYAVVPVVWDRAGEVELSGLDALVVRSCWNYHQKYQDFLKWLGFLRDLKIPVFNSIRLIEWNLNKKYLLEFQNVVPVPATLLVPRKTSFSKGLLEKTFGDFNTDRLVIKPAVSLNGHDTYLVSKDHSEEILPIIQSLLENRDLLFQEFIPEIQSEGEVSLIYFNRQFSHAIRKVPAHGEFRIHREYGGTRQSTAPSREALDFSEKLLEHVQGDLLYARVDLVETAKGPVLVELEITDPMLYMYMADGAPERFATAIDQALEKSLRAK